MAKNSVQADKIILKNVRLSFLRLDKPEPFEEGQTPKYQATGLLDPSDADHAAQIKGLQQAGKKLMLEAYGEIPADIKADPIGQLCYGLADKHPKKAKYDGYEGMFYVTTSNSDRVGCANRKGVLVLPGDPEFPYSGCYGNLSLSLWALLGPKRNKYGARIGANLRAVQFVRDGEAFGAGPVNVEDEFEALEDNGPADTGDVGDFNLDDDDDIPF
jgi:hypothetical protein